MTTPPEKVSNAGIVLYMLWLTRGWMPPEEIAAMAWPIQVPQSEPGWTESERVVRRVRIERARSHAIDLFEGGYAHSQNHRFRITDQGIALVDSWENP